jgi:hypothetical protein
MGEPQAANWHDAPVVSRLRAAGAVLIGRTNMTEFAFSGVGINPHYGTPGRSPADPRRIIVSSPLSRAVSGLAQPVLRIGHGAGAVAIDLNEGATRLQSAVPLGLSGCRWICRGVGRGVGQHEERLQAFYSVRSERQLMAMWPSLSPICGHTT